MTPHRQKPHTEHLAGFSLAEVIVGLLIVALATGIAGISLSERQSEMTKAAFANQTIRLLRIAHRDAMMTGSTRFVDFNLPGRSIDYRNGTKHVQIPASFDLTLLVGKELVTARGSVPVAFFGEGGSTGVRVTVRDSHDMAIHFQTSWLTGLTEVIEE